MCAKPIKTRGMHVQGFDNNYYWDCPILIPYSPCLTALSPAVSKAVLWAILTYSPTDRLSRRYFEYNDVPCNALSPFVKTHRLGLQLTIQHC